MPETQEMADMHHWLREVTEALGLPEGLVSSCSDQVLSLTREVSHGPTRPGAPMTAFAVGVALGASGQVAGPDQAATQLTEVLKKLDGPLTPYRNRP